jgi:hypothetical protein
MENHRYKKATQLCFSSVSSSQQQSEGISETIIFDSNTAQFSMAESVEGDVQIPQQEGNNEEVQLVQDPEIDPQQQQQQ